VNDHAGFVADRPSTMVGPLVCVLAGNAREAERWFRANDVPWHRQRYIARVEHLYGLRGVRCARVGTWYANPAYASEHFAARLMLAEHAEA